MSEKEADRSTIIYTGDQGAIEYRSSDTIYYLNGLMASEEYIGTLERKVESGDLVQADIDQAREAVRRIKWLFSVGGILVQNKIITNGQKAIDRVPEGLSKEISWEVKVRTLPSDHSLRRLCHLHFGEDAIVNRVGIAAVFIPRNQSVTITKSKAKGDTLRYRLNIENATRSVRRAIDGRLRRLIVRIMDKKASESHISTTALLKCALYDISQDI